MSGVDLSTPERVIAWWLSEGPVSSAAEPASAVAMAMRYKMAWELHRDKLADMTKPSAYSKTNRETLARAMRAFIYAMDRAQEGSADG